MQLVVDNVENYAPVTLYSPEMTEEDFAEFCERYPDYLVEYTADGELIIMPPTSIGTGRSNTRINTRLDLWAMQDGKGFATDSSTGFLLPNGARRSPDAAWILESRYRPQASRKWPALCPDFVIELRSSSDRLRALRAKMEEYAENGASLGWLIDPIRREVTVYRPAQEPHVLENPAVVKGEGLVEGFELQMSEIWGSGDR
jgi:Uma2 family endonuclease